jgi:hypothetical protein
MVEIKPVVMGVALSADAVFIVYGMCVFQIKFTLISISNTES